MTEMDDFRKFSIFFPKISKNFFAEIEEIPKYHCSHSELNIFTLPNIEYITDDVVLNLIKKYLIKNLINV
jgi:hypothetical protein